MGLLGNPIHRRLPRDARHIVRVMLRRGTTGRHRAGVLHAHVGALDHAVNRAHRNSAAPADTAAHAPGVKVRLGTNVRDLLRKLRDTKNVRAQQALVREIRHDIAKRIAAAERWKKVRAKAREARKRAGRWVAGRARAGAGWARAVPQRGGQGRPGLGTVRVRVRRTPAAAPARLRFGVEGRASRSRFGRDTVVRKLSRARTRPAMIRK